LCASKFFFTTKDTKRHKENLNEVLRLRRSPALVIFVSFVVKFRQNKSPFAIALGDWFPFRSYFLTSKASPNDREIIVIVIIIIGEVELVSHSDGIIAQIHVVTINFENQIEDLSLKCPMKSYIL